MAKEKLEKVLEYLINKDEAKATALLHKIFVEKAREIHESLMQDEEGMDSAEEIGDKQDGIEEEEMAFEEYFREDDLVGDEEGEEDAVDDLEGEMDVDAETMDDEVTDEIGDEEVAGEEAVEDTEEVETDIESQIEDLQAKFDELQTELEALKGEEGMDGEEDMGSEEDMGDESGEEMAADDEEMAADDEEVAADDEEMAADDEEMAEESASIYGDDDSVFEELDALLGKDFDDLAESVSLEKVSNSMSEDGGVGNGEKITPNKKSPVESHGVRDRVKQAAPVKIKSTEHSGFDRETAPTVKTSGGGMPTGSRNTGKSSMNAALDGAGRPKMNKEGDSSALINKGKSDGFGEEGKKSPISGSTKVAESRKAPVKTPAKKPLAKR